MFGKFYVFVFIVPHRCTVNHTCLLLGTHLGPVQHMRRESTELTGAGFGRVFDFSPGQAFVHGSLCRARAAPTESSVYVAGYVV